MTSQTVITYEGPRDARHYELLKQIGGSLDLKRFLLDGKRHLHTNTETEFGHGLYTANVDGGSLEHIWVKDVIGDGFLFGCSDPHDGDNILGPTQNITGSELTAVGCQRNGMAFIGAKNIHLKEVSLVDSWGSLPRGPHAGVDFEPDKAETPNENITLESFLISNNQGFGIVSDMGGPNTFGIRFRRGRVIAHREGWAILWRAARSEQYPWHRFEDMEVHGPVSGLTNAWCKNVRFHSMPDSQCSPFGLEMEHDQPVVLENCYINGTRIVPGLQNPALYLNNPNLKIL